MLGYGHLVRGPEGGTTEVIDLFAADRELGSPSAAPDVGLSGGGSAARVVHLSCGDWCGDLGVSMLGFLLLSGFLIRRVELAGRQSAELLGPGDLIRPYEVEGDEYEMVPSQASWQVLSPARLAVLDERFVRRTRGDPELLERLLARMLRRSQTLALRLALVQLPNLTARLHFLLWHLADRFGRVEPSGVLLALPLSHANLAELVSAQRPSVSRAMKRLEREGLISPANDCGWLLGGPAPKSPSEPVAASIRRSNGRR